MQIAFARVEHQTDLHDYAEGVYVPYEYHVDNVDPDAMIQFYVAEVFFQLL